MMVQTQHKRKRRRKAGVANVALTLALGALLFFVYKEINADAKDSDRPVEAQDSITVSRDYAVIEMDDDDLAQGELVLVNKAYPYDFPDSLALVSIYDHKSACYFVRDKNVLIDKYIMTRLNDMMEAFSEETGLRDVNVVAGHRTYDIQQKLYNEGLETKGAEHTAKYIAQPGCSEHHTGLAVDFSVFHNKTGDSAAFKGSGDYGWFDENSHAYGFVLRFKEDKSAVTGVADEPWHFRYVGIPHAYYIKQNDLCLEEYIDLLRGYPYDGEHLIIDTDGQKYEAYFCAGFDVHVPVQDDYTVSGNNSDGFVVTVSIG